MKIQTLVLLSAGLSILLPGLLKAQQPNTGIEFIKRLPTVNWQDDQHYVTYRSSGSGRAEEIIVDVISGKETISSRKMTPRPKFFIAKNGTVLLKNEKSGQTDTLKGLKNPAFSPDSSHIAYTKNNDLYVISLGNREEWRVTNDGSSTVYNGWSSWIYNEEILGRGTNYRAFWWSHDSKKIAFMHFDDTKVPVHYLVSDTGIHAQQIPLRYPLPGDANPEVKIGIAKLQDKSLTWADYNPKTDQYFGTPVWTPSSEQLWVEWMNRGQDTLKIESIDLRNGNRKPIYTETQKTWISLDQENRITFVPAKKIFILMSDKDGWMHLYAYNMEGKPLRQLSSGNWTVTELNYVDEKAGMVYFTAKKENSTRLDLYKVSLNGGKIQRLTFGDYMHRVQLSPGAKYFITNYSNFNSPAKLALVDHNGKIIREIADSRGKDFNKYLAQASKSEIIRVTTPDGFDLPVRITLPSGFNPNKKYPLIARIYGGPNSAFVNDGYQGNYSDKADDQKELINIQMDHRGSGHFGKRGQNFLHRDLGHWEIEDYSFVINYLKKKYPFIDGSRIGISGFSYGGYISALALTKAPEVFTVGLAGGSVTDWRFYDSAYTERYMDSPKENPEGYKSSSVLTYAKNLKGHLSLAQGTMDDNVHMRNTMKLVDALQEARKQFDLMFYPGAAHGWYYLQNKAAQYNTATSLFIEKYLLKETEK